jgi:hypothetical protein
MRPPRADRSRHGHVLAILPRGEALRNFVYSGTLDRVADRAALTVLTVVPSEELQRDLQARFGAVYPLEPIPESRLVGHLREILEVAHGRWLWSEAAQSRWRVRDFEATTPARRLKRLAKKAASYPFAHRQGLHLLSTIERAASRALKTNHRLMAFLRAVNPTLVFNASHVHSEIAVQAVQAARWLGIPTATFIFSWDNLTSQGRIITPYDHYIVWNESLRDQLLDIYDVIRPEQVVVTGTPQFDYHFRPEFFWSREEFCRRVGADPARPLVVYTTGMANPMFGEPRIVEGVADAVARAADLGRPQLLVRVYPKDRTGRFEDLKQRRRDILFPEVPWEPHWLTPKYDDLFLLTNTLRHADVGINAASTISLELCMLDRPVINIGYNPPGIDIWPWDYGRFYRFEHYRPVTESGAVAIAWSEDEIDGLLREALQHPERRRRERRALVERMFGNTLDGRAAARVADWLLTWAAPGEAARPVADDLVVARA